MDNCIICVIVIKDPGEQPIVANIPATMEALQKAVGGHIEAVNIASDLTLLLSTEGLLMGLPYNHTLFEMPIVGPIVAVGVYGEKFVSLNPDQIRIAMSLLREPESDLRGGDK